MSGVLFQLSYPLLLPPTKAWAGVTTGTFSMIGLMNFQSQIPRGKIKTVFFSIDSLWYYHCTGLVTALYQSWVLLIVFFKITCILLSPKNKCLETFLKTFLFETNYTWVRFFPEYHIQSRVLSQFWPQWSYLLKAKLIILPLFFLQTICKKNDCEIR